MNIIFFLKQDEKDTVSIVFGVKYVLAEDTLLESQYKFRFEVKDLKNFLKYEDGNVLVIQELMPHFLSVAVGTMRGILVVRTAGTRISEFPLPMINVEELCSSLMTADEQ